MRALSLLLSIAALLTVPSCSFLGLDNLPVAGCTMDSQCDGLERLEPPASECETWQCNGGFCELATRDEDEDGVSPMLSPSMLMCTQPGDPIDCDDGAGVTFPGNPEVCDGLDNDCDGLVDQGQPGVMLGADRSFTTITGSALSAVVANGGGLDGTELAGLFVVTGTPRNQLVVTGRDVTDRALSLMVGPTPSAPNRLVGLAPVSQRWAVLFVPGGSCDRLALAAFNATDSVVNVDPPLHTAGLPTEAGAMCNTATRGSLAPNSGSDRHLLVAYTNAAAACGTASSAPVYAIDAVVPASGVPTIPTSPLVLGESGDFVAPAAINLAASTYLVAYPTASGSIEVRRVDTSGGSSSVVYTEPAGGARSGVSLAFDGDRGVVLTWSMDCGAAPSEVRFLTTDTAHTTLTAGAHVVLERGADLSTAAYQPVLDEWLFVSSSAGNWSGQRLDANGGALGPAFDVRSLESQSMPVVSALASGAAYEVFGAHASTLRRPTGQSTLDTVGCLP
jgi:hypothetical protein